MKASTNPQQCLQQYKRIIKTQSFPLKLKLYFSELEDLFLRPSSTHTTKYQQLDQQFVGKFVGMTPQDQEQLMNSLIKAVVEQIKGMACHLKTASQPQQQFGYLSPRKEQTLTSINRIETSCKLETSNWGLTVWLEVKFKFECCRRIITLSNKKKNIAILLENYIMRQSKKRKHTLVFEAVAASVSQEHSKISLYFEESIYPTIYNQLFKTIVEIQKELLLRKFTGQLQYSQRSPQLSDRLPLDVMSQGDKNLVFLSAEQISNYLKQRSGLLKKLKDERFAFRVVYRKVEENLSIHKSSKKENCYLLQFCLQTTSIQKAKMELLNGYMNRCRYRTGRNIVQQYSKRFKAIYDRYLISGKIYEQISIEEQCASNEDVLYVKGIQNVMTENFIRCLYIKASKNQSNRIAVTVFASLLGGKKLPQQSMTSFLLQFRDMLLRSQQEQTVLQIEKHAQQEEIFYSLICSYHEDDLSVQLDANQKIATERPIELKKAKSINTANFLTNRHHTQPKILMEDELQSKKLKEHYLLKEWSRCKSGGVVCTNEAMLQEQKKMIKSIIANIGANIYKIVRTGGLLTMSLPVTIFKKESHLQTIANNFTFAPLLFDKLPKDPLQRLKKAVIFTLSVSNLGISSQKPFNPILGQTLQCWIAGCPLYLQQITHQPPNSAFHLQGRGYRITGQIESKVGIAGLNTAKCWSERPNLIEFQDGSKLALIFPRMLIKGILMGDREFHFEDKVYVYDMTNHYFAELFLGPRNRKGKSDPEDYIYGRILLTTPAYLHKFKSKFPPVFPTKQDIAKEICQIQGIWNQGICFGGVEEFNFTTILPYILQMDEHPLPSNSTFRKDLQHYISGSTMVAQEHKETMEQQQRRDRKLREQYSKK